jgi:UDPglucose 6-dehydrogenase
MEPAKAVLSDVEYAGDAYACAEGASALVIVTEWDIFDQFLSRCGRVT